MVVWQLLALAVAAMALPVAVPWLGFVFTVAIGKGMAALGVAMLLRGGLISIGHALYVAIGAYATAFLMLSLGMNELFLLLIYATVITTAAGLVIGAFMARYRAIFFAMLNLAISMVFFTLLSKLYNRSSTVRIFKLLNTRRNSRWQGGLALHFG
jgi:branched-chain amino acid transport system permease protein